MRDEEKDIFDVYCNICGSCGEDGCCPATMCQQHADGMYCPGYLDDLKFGYLMFKDTYDLLKKHCPGELDRIYNENYKFIYKGR